MIGILAGMGPMSTAPFIDLLMKSWQKHFQVKDDIDFPHNEAEAIHLVKSPIDGVVEKTDLALGDMVLSGDLLVNVTSNTHLQIEYQLSINQAEKAKVGQQVTFTSNHQTLDGVVSYISDESSDRNLVTLRADVINASGQTIRANTFGKVIQTINKNKNTILINQNLIQTDSSGFYVFLNKKSKI